MHNTLALCGSAQAGCTLLLTLTTLLGPLPSWADEGHATNTIIEIDYDLTSNNISASEGSIRGEQINKRPLLRPGEVLETVPGLIVSQHSGNGKANQYYVRGFNLDHGTDFATTLMGMPLNMPTHGHGQGYLDLQFLLPELIEQVRYRKGPISADVGDFATAGSASIDYLNSLPAPLASLSIGEDGYRRGLIAGSKQTPHGVLLHALELHEADGPWELPEDLSKRNGLLRYSQGSRHNGWSVSGLAYRSRWNATDQIPQRAIRSGQVSRFGHIDPSDGGVTERYSVSYEWAQRIAAQQHRANAYAISSRLNLFSNFTYCLTDSSPTCANGDQFEQVDQRKVYGGGFSQHWHQSVLNRPGEITLGVQGRFDDIAAVALHTTTARQRTGTIRRDRVKEVSLGVYVEQQMQWQPTLRSRVGLRSDHYRFDVRSDNPVNSGQRNAQITSPKVALIFGPWHQTEYYLQASSGFHSNDARGVTSRINPDFRDNDTNTGFGKATQPADPLVRALSYEFGLRAALTKNLQASLALWQLDLDSELLFIGDAGTTEPSAPSRRRGIEVTHDWLATPHLTIDTDLAWSQSRLRAGDPGARRIPGSIEKTASVSAFWHNGRALSGGLRLRYFGPRALTEDGSVSSKSSLLTNVQVSYDASRQLKFRLDALNLFNRRVSDIDYFYASKLAGESAAVDDIHTHPAEPRTVRGTIQWSF